jgi:hypothetical protein
VHKKLSKISALAKVRNRGRVEETNSQNSSNSSTLRSLAASAPQFVMIDLNNNSSNNNSAVGDDVDASSGVDGGAAAIGNSSNINKNGSASRLDELHHHDLHPFDDDAPSSSATLRVDRKRTEKNISFILYFIFYFIIIF